MASFAGPLRHRLLILVFFVALFGFALSHVLLTRRVLSSYAVEDEVIDLCYALSQAQKELHEAELVLCAAKSTGARSAPETIPHIDRANRALSTILAQQSPLSGHLVPYLETLPVAVKAAVDELRQSALWHAGEAAPQGTRRPEQMPHMHKAQKLLADVQLLVVRGFASNLARQRHMQRIGMTLSTLAAFAILLSAGLIANAKRKADRRLRLSEARYRMIVETAQEGIWAMDPEGNTLVVNDRMAEMLGYTREQLSEKSFLDVIEESAQPEARRHLSKSTRLLRRRTEFKFKRQDGTFVWVLISTGRLRGDDGQVAGTLAMVVDITPLKKAEAELRIKDHAIESSLSAFAILDLSGRVDYVNHACLALWGFESASDMVGRPAEEFWADETEPNKIFKTLQRGQQWSGQLKARRADGTLFDVEVHASRVHDESGRPIALMASMVDVTEREQAVSALRESEARWRSLTEHSPDYIMTVDRDGAILFINRTEPGSTREEIIGTSLFQYAYPGEEQIVRDSLDAVFKSGKPCSFESTYERPDGQLRRLESIVGPIFRDDRVVMACIRSSDVTDQKNARIEVERSRARLQALLDATPHAALLIRRDGTILEANRVLAEIFDAPLADLIGSCSHDLIPPELAQSRRAYIRRVFDTGKPVQFQDERAGRILSHSLYPAFDRDGRVEAVAIFGEDITERTRAVEALEHSHEVERQFSERLSDLHDVSTAIAEAKTPDEVCKRAVSLGISELGFDRLSIWLTTDVFGVLRGTYGTDEEGRVRDEREVRAETEPNSPEFAAMLGGFTCRVCHDEVLLDHKGEVVGRGDRAVATLMDGERVVGYLYADNLLRHEPIDERQRDILTLLARAVGHVWRLKVTESELRRSEAIFRLMTENARDVVYRYHLAGSGGFDYMSPACTKMLGYTPDEFYADFSLRESILHPDDRERVLDLLARDPSTSRIEMRFVAKDGSVVWVEAQRTAFVDETGKPVAVEGILRDITLRRRLERRIVAIRDEEQQRLGRELHDTVCQQLAGISYMSQNLAASLARENSDHSSDAAVVARLIAETQASARRMVRGLAPVDLEPAGLVAALKALCSDTEMLHNVRCVFKGEDAAAIGAEGIIVNQLYRIAREAVNNAAKHAGAGQIAVEFECDDRTIRVAILDDGKGLPADLGAHTGIGLQLMRHRASLIDANIEFRPNRPNGTVVECTVSYTSDERKDMRSHVSGEEIAES